MRHYPIELTPDDNGTFLVTCPDLPEVTTFGEDAEAAAAHASDAIEEALAARAVTGGRSRSHRRPAGTPRPSARRWK